MGIWSKESMILLGNMDIDIPGFLCSIGFAVVSHTLRSSWKDPCLLCAMQYLVGRIFAEREKELQFG